MDEILKFYANPKNWTGDGVLVPGPYSSSGKTAEVLADRGRNARDRLNLGGTQGSFIQLMCDLLGLSLVQVASMTEIHPGRIQDAINNQAFLLTDEKRRMARVFNINVEELE